MENDKPIIDETRLVTYKLPADGKMPMREKTLDNLQIISDVAVMVAVIMGGVWAVMTLLIQGGMWLRYATLPSSSWYVFEPFVPWWLAFGLTAVAIFTVAASIRVSRFASDEAHLTYRYVPQGMITAMDTRGGGSYALRWVLLVEGYNSRNELRTVEHIVTAGEWKSDYEVGDYVDFRDDEDKANSATEPRVVFESSEVL